VSNTERLQELSEDIETGRKVQEVLDSNGWKDVIEPLIDKMIIDVLGAKESGRWTNGSLSLSDLGKEEAKSLIAYKRALTDLHTYIYDVIDTAEQSRKEYEELLKEDSGKPQDYPSDYNIAVIT